MYGVTHNCSNGQRCIGYSLGKRYGAYLRRKVSAICVNISLKEFDQLLPEFSYTAQKTVELGYSLPITIDREVILWRMG